LSLRAGIADDVGHDRPDDQGAPTSARRAGISWNASHTQKGISGVSSVAIRDACPDGNRREPRKNKVRPNAT